MKRIVMVRIGRREVHLVRLLGVLIITASLIGAIGSLSQTLLSAKQVELSLLEERSAMQLFGLEPSMITPELVIGHLISPLAHLVLWLGLMVIGAMVYKAGGLVLPIEEEIKEKKG